MHIFAWPFVHLHLPGMAGKVEYAQLLHDGSEVKLLERGPAASPTARAVAGGDAVDVGAAGAEAGGDRCRWWRYF